MNVFELVAKKKIAKTKSSQSFPQFFFLIWRFALTQTPGGGTPPDPPVGSQGNSHKSTNSQTVKRTDA